MECHSGDEKLVSTSWLTDNLGTLLDSTRIVEVSDMKNPNAYFEGHIPGAVHWPWKKTLWDATMREFLSPEDFAQLMGKNGVGHETTVIFYSNSCQYAHYAFWVCMMRGHSQAKVLHGNRTLWVKERRPLVDDIPQMTPVSYPVRAPDQSSRIGREGILAGLNNPDRVLVDVRTLEEFMGERVSPKSMEVDHGAERKGHIPGAKHLFYAELLQEDDTFKPRDELRDLFYARGATPDREVIFYCRLSHRASMAWFAARFLLGYPRTRVYDGSWTEWGSIVGLPIVNESLK
jgi:thiosulfate/3-mercaptopyruvate sulfurtransferase